LIAAVCASPLLARCSDLELRDACVYAGRSRRPLGDELVARLVSSDALPPLRSLAVVESGVGSASIAALRGCERLRRVESLDLSGHRFGEAASQLLAGGHFAKLRRLALASDTTMLWSLEHAALARECGFETIEDIDVSFNAWRGIDVLATSPNLRMLRAAHMGDATSSDRYEVLGDLVEASENLVRLDLGGNVLEDEHAPLLARTWKLAELERLDLRGNDISLEGARVIASSPYLPSLQFLDLRGNADVPTEAAEELERLTRAEVLCDPDF
jgi:Ran GTPase-activating protein (RanGAP) involved in mRNA processing and transport